ncbi:hypothetical protein CEUSTIGMA_g86.t1 [Chlamydomonas eustigma]|uniref:Uncharacterized protein n=1 Tax=Chlamydomonas eustigma TaxID=1157962 RepID=A0A250WQ10_9CHLO|nr:hypothetical protein CEUSTIGMA_g86.t1 [Chlamydomonas eustigma]|eukprot:GAX72630.1 hypothetical protein CEUSTIGMA_g86.t1 [Chlamydomonas eustigma]
MATYSQRTRDDPSPLSPWALTFRHPDSPWVVAVASALAGITSRGSSRKSEPSLADSSDPFSAQLLASIQQSVKIYMDQRLQAQEFAAQASQAAFEKKLLEKVERIEDDKAFFRDKVATEVTKLAEQVKAQHELKVDVADNVTLEDLDQVWNQLNALQNVVFPEPGSLSPSLAFHSALYRSPPPSSSGYPSSNIFDPNSLTPPPHTVVPQPAHHAQQYPVPAALASHKQRNLPNISEVDHGGHTSFNMGIHAGTRRAPLPHSSPPDHEHPSSSHASEGASHHQHSHAKQAPAPAYVPAHVPSDSRRSTPVNYVSHRPPPSTTSTGLPQGSLSLRPPPIQLDQQSSSWIENSLSLGSLAQSPHTLHNALSHSPSPSTSEYQNPVTLNPNPHRVLPEAADHVQHLLVVPSVPNRERDLPRVTEIDHGGSVVPFRVSHSHLGAQGMCNKMPLVPSPLPAPDHSPSPQSSDEGVSHLPYSCAIASPPTPLVGHHPSGSHRAALISSSSHSLQLSTCHLPPVSRHDSSHAPSTSGRSDGPDVPVVLAVSGHYMPPQPAVLTQPFAPRPSGATGVVGPPSTSQSSRTPCVGTSPCKVMCDVCKSVHWTRSCPIRFQDMSIYSKFMKDQGINPTYNVPVVGSLVHVPQGMDGFDEPWSNFPSLPPHESASTVYSGGGLHTK